MFMKSKKEIGPYWPVSPDLCVNFFFIIVYCWHLIVITGANMAVVLFAGSSFLYHFCPVGHGVL